MNTETKPNIHFVNSHLLNATNPITVNLIGAGGTGSHMLYALARINFAHTTLGKAGLQVNVFDPDQIESPNLGRAAFNENFIGLNKAVALVAYINRSYGTNWKAVPESFQVSPGLAVPENRKANITICCVDTVKARFEIIGILNAMTGVSACQRENPMYCMDFGNSKYTGQVILSTVGSIKQPESKKFTTVGNLPSVTAEYKYLLESMENDTSPSSCSLLESLNKQSLFVNSALANLGGAMLDQMLETGALLYRGFFMNLETFKTEAIVV